MSIGEEVLILRISAGLFSTLQMLQEGAGRGSSCRASAAAAATGARSLGWGKREVGNCVKITAAARWVSVG